MTDHKSSCECSTCRDLRTKTIATEDWRKAHEHGTIIETDAGHPDGKMKWLRCLNCGARHLTNDRLDKAENLKKEIDSIMPKGNRCPKCGGMRVHYRLKGYQCRSCD